MDPKLQTFTDDELVEAFCKGDSNAFEMLVLRYKNPLYQYIMSMTQDEGAAADLFQETFISFFKNADKYEARGKFKSWLFLAARNRTLNFFRDRDKLASLDQPPQEDGLSLHDTLADDSLGPLEALSGRETAEEIRRAALTLPERQREIIYLRPYFSFKEMAQMLGRPLGTVLSDFSRAVKKMQLCLARQNAPEDSL